MWKLMHVTHRYVFKRYVTYYNDIQLFVCILCLSNILYLYVCVCAYFLCGMSYVNVIKKKANILKFY